MLELVLLGRYVIIFSKLSCKIFFIAEVEQIGNFLDGIITVFQPLLGELHCRAHNILIYGLLIFCFKDTAGIYRCNVKLFGNVCGILGTSGSDEYSII